jgi:hypothetical protein
MDGVVCPHAAIRFVCCYLFSLSFFDSRKKGGNVKAIGSEGKRASLSAACLPAQVSSRIACCCLQGGLDGVVGEVRGIRGLDVLAEAGELVLEGLQNEGK